jgi:hypothetical protein
MKIEPSLITGGHASNGNDQFLSRQDEALEPYLGKPGKFQNPAPALTLPFHCFDH